MDSCQKIKKPQPDAISHAAVSQVLTGKSMRLKNLENRY